jgi:hypothetical protein
MNPTNNPGSTDITNADGSLVNASPSEETSPRSTVVEDNNEIVNEEDQNQVVNAQPAEEFVNNYINNDTPTAGETEASVSVDSDENSNSDSVNNTTKSDIKVDTNGDDLSNAQPVL